LQVRLTLLKHLLGYHLPQSLPVLGATYSAARVVRADKALGVLLRLPATPSDPPSAAPVAAAAPALAYVHISNLADGNEVPAKVSDKFPPGKEVTAKVTGFRVMDGLAAATLRASDLAAASSVTWSSIEAGQVLTGTVHRVEEAGVLVQLAPAVRGLVPLAHVSEAAAPKKLKSRFKAGQALRVRCARVALCA
jgi:rRNA biogenesis protein RRP5